MGAGKRQSTRVDPPTQKVNPLSAPESNKRIRKKKVEEESEEEGETATSSPPPPPQVPSTSPTPVTASVSSGSTPHAPFHEVIPLKASVLSAPITSHVSMAPSSPASEGVRRHGKVPHSDLEFKGYTLENLNSFPERLRKFEKEHSVVWDRDFISKENVHI